MSTSNFPTLRACSWYAGHVWHTLPNSVKATLVIFSGLNKSFMLMVDKKKGKERFKFLCLIDWKIHFREDRVKKEKDIVS